MSDIVALGAVLYEYRGSLSLQAKHRHPEESEEKHRAANAAFEHFLENGIPDVTSNVFQTQDQRCRAIVAVRICLQDKSLIKDIKALYSSIFVDDEVSDRICKKLLEQVCDSVFGPLTETHFKIWKSEDLSLFADEDPSDLALLNQNQKLH